METVKKLSAQKSREEESERAEAEADQQRRAEEQARRRAEAESRRRAEQDARREAEAEARQKIEEDARRAAQLAARRKAEAARKAEAEARAMDAEVIMMGVATRRRAGNRIFGRTVDYVLHNAPCRVVVSSDRRAPGKGATAALGAALSNVVSRSRAD